MAKKQTQSEQDKARLQERTIFKLDDGESLRAIQSAQRFAKKHPEMTPEELILALRKRGEKTDRSDS